MSLDGYDSENTVYRNTYYCSTCGKIDCFTTNPSLAIEYTLENINCKIVIPDSFKQLLLMLKIDKDALSNIIEKLMKNMYKQINTFIETGINPHKNNSIGFNKNINIDKHNINLSVLMENIDGNLVLRIIYDGGSSQWY